MSHRELELRYGAGTYQKRDITIASGRGVYVTDDTGKSYIDCIAGIGTAILGHGHPELTAAIADQAAKIMSLPELLCSPVRSRLQEKLVRVLPHSFERVFLCNSGTEAVEGALKFVRLTTGRHGVVALKRGYHGKTLGSLSVTAEEKYRQPFAPLLSGVNHVSALRVDELREVFERQSRGEIAPVGAFIFEPIQGESGVFPLSREVITEAVEIARANGALIISDEIQAGFGRTGRMWAHEHLGIEPDLICMAKAIAGGVPMGAIGIGSRVAPLPTRSHTSTFGGNPLACRAALTVLEVMERDRLVERAEEIGSYLMEQIRALNLPPVREVRGKGLMIGIELKNHAVEYIERCSAEGLLCLLAGQRVIRLLPPLILSREEADDIVSILDRVLRGKP